MTPEAAKYLSVERPGALHDALVEHLVALGNQSRDEMKKHYQKWKVTDASFRAQPLVNTANKEEIRKEQKADERSEPGKFVLPIGHSQIDTFVSFGYQMFTQKECIYELEAMGLEDELASKLAERALEYDLEHSNFRGAVLTQYLTDIGRYSFGVLKYTWAEETQTTEQEVPTEVAGIDDLPQVPKTEEVTEVTFQGNNIVNTSVYRFLPDPRVPIYRFQEGEFCGDEDFVGRHKLEQQEADGIISGLQWVQPVNTKALDSGRDFPFDPTKVYQMGRRDINAPLILTEMQVVLTPSKFMAETDDKAGHSILGTSDRPTKFLFWILNDNRIVRMEKLVYPLNRFTWEVGVMGPDAENFLGLSLYDVIGNLQSTADWLINSRITDIRKHIGLDMIVDESALNVSDLKERKSIIRLNKNAQGTDVNRYVKQLSRNDTTQGNIEDTLTIHQYAKEGTGLTDNLVGQFSQGRRSAREASQVFSNAANRIRTAMATIWFTGLKPLGRALLANLRYGLTMERIIKLSGVPNNPAQAMAGAASFLSVTAADLAGNFDFKIFDGTMPSERQQQAAALQEFLTAGMQNPQMFMVAGLNPQPMLEDLFELRGIKNVSKYRLPPERIIQMASLLGLAGNPAATAGGGGEAQVPAGTTGQQPRNSNGGANPNQSGGGQVIAFPQQ